MEKQLKLLSNIVYGPVPSRRLGRSMGINNIPPKYCTYSCIYCQLGRNKWIGAERRYFYAPSGIVKQTEKKIAEAQKRNEHIDYLAFVPDGEPSLDINIGTTIRMLKSTGIKTAVVTNSSLLTDKKVREDISGADWVSLKIDAVKDDEWRAVNRPHRSLDIKKILEAAREFAGQFSGRLATETMLVEGFNTDPDELHAVADFIGSLKPHTSYISVPIRPPAEKSALAPDESCVNFTYQLFLERTGTIVECLTGHEGNHFAHTGDIVNNILEITSVHPMREDTMRTFISEAGAGWDIIQQLILEKKLEETVYDNKKFYIRKFDHINTG